MEELVMILDDDIDRLLSAVTIPTSEGEVDRELSGRESPPPEAPPRVQVEGRVAQIKLILLGDTEKPPDLSQCQELAAALLRPRAPRTPGGSLRPPVLARLILHLKAMPFESRKHTAQIFGNFMRRGQKVTPDDLGVGNPADPASATAAPNEGGGPLGFWAGVAALGQQQQQQQQGADTSPPPLLFSSLKALLLAGVAPPLGPETVETEARGGVEGVASAVPVPSEASAQSGAPPGTPALNAEGAAADVMAALVAGCGDPTVALNSGAMLRDAIRDPQVTAAVLARPDVYVWPFFEKSSGSWVGGFLDCPNFDVSSDAFATLKDLLTRHKGTGVVRSFLDDHYEKVFGEPEASVDAKPVEFAPPPSPPPAAPAAGDPGAAAAAAGAASQSSFDLGQQQASGAEARAAAAGVPPGGGGAPAGGAVGSASGGGSSDEGTGGRSEGAASMSAAEVRSARLVGLYGGLLGQGRNFFTRRQSLKLLAELLLDRANFSVMMRFISSKHNLRQMMHLLVDRSKNIQFEAFHVFKVFVANPRKPPEIVADLLRNQQRLVTYLEPFHADRQDAQFVEEKALIIKELKGLQPPPQPAPAAVTPPPPPSPGL